MVSDPLPADSASLDLRFEPSTEERAFAWISILTALGCVVFLLLHFIRQRKP
jgi:hypothetical protein